MNTTSKREPEDLVDNKRWMAYATASAAGALVCQGAEASIIYVYENVGFQAPAVSGSTTGYFALDENASASMSFISLAVASSNGAYFGMYGPGAKFAGTSTNGFAYAQNLAPGQLVSATSSFLSGSAAMASGSGYSNSQFLTPGIGILGFQFNDLDGELQHGWARVEMSGVPTNSFTLIDYAYTTAGEKIRAGVPEPGSLGLLAAGAAGLAIARRRRRKKNDG